MVELLCYYDGDLGGVVPFPPSFLVVDVTRSALSHFGDDVETCRCCCPHLSDPMVDVMGAVGDRTGISSFYISFVLAPLASNASELIAAFNYSLKKTSRTIVISFAALQVQFPRLPRRVLLALCARFPQKNRMNERLSLGGGLCLDDCEVMWRALQSLTEAGYPSATLAAHDVV